MKQFEKVFLVMIILTSFFLGFIIGDWKSAKALKEKESALKSWEEMANKLDEYSLTGMTGADTIDCCLENLEKEFENRTSFENCKAAGGSYYSFRWYESGETSENCSVDKDLEF